jgi:hypothetical protein
MDTQAIVDAIQALRTTVAAVGLGVSLIGAAIYMALCRIATALEKEK